MRRTIYILLFVLLLSGCRSVRLPVSQTNSDSTLVETVEVVKIITIPGDTVRVGIPIILRGDTQFIPARVVAESRRAAVSIEITTDGHVLAEAICKELEEKVTFLETTITNYKQRVEIYEHKESWLQQSVRKTKIWFYAAVVFGILVLLAWVVSSFQPVLNVIKRIFKFK